MPIVGDVKRVLQKLNKVLQELAARDASRRSRRRARSGGRRSATGRKSIRYDAARSETEIKPQHLMAEIDRLSGGQAIVSSDVGQHQMWAAQFIRFNEPRLWINSGGLGSMGFGVPVGHRRADGPSRQAGVRDLSATAASRCPFRSWPPSPTTACPSRSS